ncbi:MAG: hypothetical protein M0R80_14060 [Proteobacteria bacterium]|jgi:hypothetical protein|nr:hypothetical protein [Pseudomonadota bacterium]
MIRGLAALAALLVACGAGKAPESAPMGGMGSTGMMGAAPEDAGAGAPDPLARPIDAPLALRFAYSLSEEISCSQSFESDGWSAKYELVLEPSGAAQLRVDAGRSHAFGPSVARFRPGMDDETTREQSGSVRTWRGAAAWKGEGFAIAFEPDTAECKALVGGRGWYAVECAPSTPLSLACLRGAVAALRHGVEEASAKDPDATVEIEVFECAPAFGLPETGELDVALPDRLPFAEAPGLELEYWRHGIGNLDTPKLRLAAPDAQVDVD